MSRFIILLAVVLLCNNLSAADYPNDERFTPYTYKSVGDNDLTLWVIQPQRDTPGEKLPVIIFFFGGGWITGTVAQFEHQAVYLARRGMVAVLAEYRTALSDGVFPHECLKDAKSAIRYLRTYSDEIGIDPDRIVAAGGSAGGHLAAATAYIGKYDHDDDDLAVSPRPDALVLYNPVIDNSPEGYGTLLLGDNWSDFSPLHNMPEHGALPTLFIIGTKDFLIPVSTAERFMQLSESAGGRCELIVYEDARHGFFNYSRRGKEKADYYLATLYYSEYFLESQGYIASQADIARAMP